MATFAPGVISRDILQLSGPESRELLQGLLTQDVADLAPGALTHGALLTPQGKIIDTMMIWGIEEGVILDLAPGRGAGALKRLTLYRMRRDVTISDETGTYHIGVAADASSVPPTPLAAATDPRFAALGVRWIAPGTPTLPITDDNFQTHEIAMGVPAFGPAYGEGEVFPLGVNLDLLNGIDHKKGCFVGQEVASRMFRKGEIRKRTWLVCGSDLSKGMEVSLAGRTVATIIAVSGDQGLAEVRLDRIGDHGGTVDAATNAGTPVTLAPPEYA